MTDRLYLKDSECLECSARVLKVIRVDEGYEVVLNRSPFYPETGGQGSDRGWLDDEPVLEVRLEGDQVFHRTARPVKPGLVRCRVDGHRRMDQMQQHSGQHVLSQVFIDLLGAPTRAFHLGERSSTIDLDLQGTVSKTQDRGSWYREGRERGKELEDAQLALAEAEANDVVRQALPVRITAPTVAELAEAPDLSAIGGAHLRIVDIHGLNRSLCCGTHVRSTAEIGPIKILSFERRGSLWRVEFLCGYRSQMHYGKLHRMAQQLTRLCSAPPERLAEAVEELLALRLDGSRRLNQLRRDLADVHAELAAQRALDLGDVKLAELVTSRLSEKELRLVGERLALLHRCAFVGGIAQEGKAKTSIVLSLPAGSPLHAGQILDRILPMLGGRGGGRPELAQGGVPASSLRPAMEKIRAELARQLGQGRP